MVIDKYTGKKLFTIQENDAGTEAYADDYVVWLERRVEHLENEVRVKQSALDWYDFEPGSMK